MVDSHHFEQVVKVIWHKTASLLQTDGSVIFARWRQRGHIGATWLIRLNLCLLRPTRVHNPNGKYWSVQPYLHSLRQKVPILYNGRPFPKKLSLPIGESEMASNTIPWAHPNPQPKHHLDRFSRFCTDDHRVSLYFAWDAPFHLKIAASHGGSGPPSNTWFPEPTRVLNPNGISIGSAVFAGLTSETDP